MKFSDIPEHFEIKQRLRTLVDQDQIPHAILLEGKPGIGKMLIARALAQYIHCPNHIDGDSCEVCPSCRQHMSMNHIDTIYSYPVLKKGTLNSISDDFAPEWSEFVTESPFMDFSQWQRKLGNENGRPIIYVHESISLIRKLNYASHGSKHKIVIMWLPEKMNVECANKLLKIIEEPPRDTVFIFTSDNPLEILPTIYSRLQRFQVSPLSETAISDILVNQNGLSEVDAREAASISSGSMTVALNLSSSLSETSEMFERFKELMRSAYQKKIIDLKKWSDDMTKNGREYLIRFLNYSERLVGENFIFNLNNPELYGLSKSESEFSSRFARFINERNVMKLRKVFIDAASDISSFTNPKMVMFDVAVKTILLLKA